MAASPYKRVALVTYALRCGGMETYLLDLAHNLVLRGYEVTIITTVERGDWFHRISGTGATALHIPLPRLFRGAQFYRVAQRLARERFDFIFLNHAIYAQAGIGMLPTSTFIISVLHNNVDEIYRVGCANRNAWNVTVAVSPALREKAIPLVPGRPVACIPNGVNIPPLSYLARRAKPSGSIKLVFVNRLEHSQKGVLFLPDILARGVQRGVDASLTVIGDGTDRDLLQKKFSDYGLLSRINMTGALPHQDVCKFLADAHILLLPSFYEGFSLVALEAMAHGCVPIASRLPGITDTYIQDGSNGFLVQIGDTDGFGDAIAALYSDAEQWEIMSQAARATTVARFSAETMTENYIRLMEECIAGIYPLPYPRRRCAFDIPLIIDGMFPISIREKLRKITRILVPYVSRDL